MPRLSSGGHPTVRYFHELPIGEHFFWGACWWIKRTTRTARVAGISLAPGTPPRRPYYFCQNDPCTIEVMK